MSKHAFESIRQGLNEAIAHAKGEPVAARIHTLAPPDIKALRRSLGFTQEQFAARLGFSVATLRHWERGDRKPHGPALVLLNIVQREPQAVLRALTEIA